MNANKIIQVILEDLDGVEYFLGGSRRFQYDNENSDIDLFLFVPKALNNPESMADHIITGDDNGLDYVLDAFGIERHESDVAENKYGMVNFHFVTTLLGTKVDLLIFTDQKAFRESKLEHECVEAYLEQYPEIRKYIKVLPGPGKLKYRAILQRLKEG
jgi:hypothetical protein